MSVTTFCLLFTLPCTCRIWQDTRKQKESMFHVCVDKRQREENAWKKLDAELREGKKESKAKFPWKFW